MAESQRHLGINIKFSQDFLQKEFDDFKISSILMDLYLYQKYLLDDTYILYSIKKNVPFRSLNKSSRIKSKEPSTQLVKNSKYFSYLKRSFPIGNRGIAENSDINLSLLMFCIKNKKRKNTWSVVVINYVNYSYLRMSV